MVQTIRARYHDGKLLPLEPLELEEGQEATVTIVPDEPMDRGKDAMPAVAGAWAGNVPDDFEEQVAADRRMGARREAPTW